MSSDTIYNVTTPTINDILSLRFESVTPYTASATNIDPQQEQPESRSVLSSIKKSTRQSASIKKYTSKSTADNFPSLSQTTTQDSENDVRKDAYRNREMSPNNYVRAAIEQQKDQIISIRMKKLSKSNDPLKKVQEDVFSPSSVGGYVNFMIQAIQTPKQERVQIVETFTTSWIYLFGQMTPIYTFSGMLLNFGGDEGYDSDSHKWANDFMKVYDEQIRGTKTIEKGAVLEMVFDKVVVQGYIINSNLSRNAMSPNGVPFTFSLAVTSEKYMGFGVYFNNQIPTKTTDEVSTNASQPKASNTKNSELMTQTLLALKTGRGNYITLGE